MITNKVSNDNIELIISDYSYELPIDYFEASLAKIHTPENISWFDGPQFNRLLRLRSTLKTLENIDQNFISL